MSIEQLTPPTKTNGSNLPEQLDGAIGEASTGIGVMLSELVRRSLKGGVANIGDTLQGYAEAQVHTAVEQQMPQLAETASNVAESTSAKFLQEKVTPTFDRLSGVVSGVESRLDSESARIGQQLTETAAEADRRLNETTEHLGSLKENAKAKWKKLVSELDTISQKNTGLTKQVAALQNQLATAEQRATEHESSVQRLSTTLQSVQTESSQLVKQLQKQNQELEMRLEKQNELLDLRLQELERPRGLKALWGKVRRGKSKPAGDEGADDN